MTARDWREITAADPEYQANLQRALEEVRADYLATTPEERADRIRAELACPDCAAEVKLTFGAAVYARVIHTAACPWLPRYLARELSMKNGDRTGGIPCGVRNVTHRGPYKRDPDAGPERAAAEPEAPHVRTVPRGPDRTAKPCRVPGCGEPADLYPAGWLCDGHRPGRNPVPAASAS